MRALTRLVLPILATCLPAQSRPRDAEDWTNPAGTVRDEDGQPIEGAVVSMRWVRGRGQGFFAKAIEQVVREEPLPRARTAGDGSYVLALAREHRLLGCGDDETFLLVADKPGYQRWVEPLPRGVGGFRGSDVVLLALRAADELRFVVKDPEPGMWLLVRRSLRAEQAWYDLDPGDLVPVPASGEVVVRMPLAPSPPLLPGPALWCLIGIDAQVLVPGRSTAPEPCAYGRANVLRPAAPPAAAAQPGPSTRDLYRCPNGDELWFARGNGARRDDGQLRFLRSDPPTESARPAPRPRPSGPDGKMSLRVTDAAGHPVAGASIRLGSALDTGDAVLGGVALRTDAHGATLATGLRKVPYYALAVAVGLEPKVVRLPYPQDCEIELAVGSRPSAAEDESYRFERPWTRTAARALADSGPPAPAARRLLLSVPLDTCVARAFSACGDHSYSAGKRLPSVRGSLGLLLAAMPRADDRHSFTLGDGVALDVQRSDVARATARGPWLASLDGVLAQRRIPLAVRDDRGSIRAGVVVVPLGPNRVVPALDTSVQLARPEPDGTWSLTLRGNGELRCAVLHEGHVPLELTIPADSERPLEAKLVAGSTLMIREAKPGFLAGLKGGGTNIRFTIRVVLDGRELVTELTTAAKLRQPGDLWTELQAPFALPPGKHTIEVSRDQSDRSQSRRLEVVAEPGKPAIAVME